MSSNQACVKNNKLSANIFIKERIGESSKYGEVFKACIPKSCKLKIAVKKIPLYKNDFKTMKFTVTSSKKNSGKSTVWDELIILHMLDKLVKKKICPHFPIYINSFICEDAKLSKFVNENITTAGIKGTLILLTDLQENTFKHFLTKNLSDTEILTSILQIYIGIYCMQKYYNLVHKDLHWSNVLYHKLPIVKGSYYEYIIDGNNILLPNIGYRMIISDFGKTTKLNQQNSSSSDKIDEWTDFYRITAMLKYGKYSKDIYKILNKLLQKVDSPLQLIKVVSKLIPIPSNSFSILDTFDTTKKL